MQHPVIVHRTRAGQYEAVALMVPTCAGTGQSRQEALTDLKHLLHDWLRSAEITTIEIDAPNVGPFSHPASNSQERSGNPWLTTAGMFKDDPGLDDMLQEIYALRDTSASEE